MSKYYQLDENYLCIGPRPDLKKGHLQVADTPPEKQDGYAIRWVTNLNPVANTKTFGDAGTGSWELVEDHRKDKLWIARGQEYKIGEDHEGQTYDGLGSIPNWLFDEEPPAPEPTITELRESKKQAATDLRWQVMTGGITLSDGTKVGTSIDDQNRITSVVANAELAGLSDQDEVDFKSESGWIRVTVENVKQIAGAVGQFVQACYSAERAHHDAIDELPDDREVIENYDVSAGWPSSSLA